MKVEAVIMPEIKRSVIGDLKAIIEADLNALRAAMIQEFNEPKTGRQYRRPSGAKYTASAPGEPPAIRTGALERSISEPNVQESPGEVVGQIVIGADYAVGLEYGRARVAPRPFVIPAIEELLRRRA